MKVKAIMYIATAVIASVCGSEITRRCIEKALNIILKNA